MKSMAVKWISGAVSLLVATAGIVGVAQSAQAVSAAGWDPGNIISDSTFFNAGSMSEQQIQDFLIAQEPTCPAYNGMPCMRNYTTTSTTRPAAPSGQCGEYIGAPVETASQVIFKVAQSCGINPQVLLVLLQKEQGLITATSPSAAAYRIATGYGCPDTAGCDAQFYGFYNQVYRAAWQFKEYTIHPSSWRYHVGVVGVQYNPNPGCGAPAVNIQNSATGALYNYTPYQPNAAALANLGGLGDGCSSYGNRNFWVYFNDWFGSPTQTRNPIGNYESTTAQVGGQIQVAGWALDPDTQSPINVLVTVNGVSTQVVANVSRPDVGAAYGLGDNHGFNTSVSSVGTGPQEVCISALNQGAGQNASLGCRTVPALTGSPLGVIDGVVGAMGTVTTRGWALDFDTTNPINVHIYVDSVGVAYLANQARPDIAAAFSLYGANHGFSFTVPASPGDHTVCVYAINQGTGSNTTIGCRPVYVPGGSPIGVVDSVVATPGQITTSGWAVDPDSGAQVPVHVYVDSAGVDFLANGSRPDVGRALPGYGDNHGFVASIPATPGSHNVCVWAINIAGTGGNPDLGCRTVTAMSGSPIGVLDSVSAANGAITAAGWTYDPDTASPNSVRIVIDSTATTYEASGVRPDLAAAFPAYGGAHGFIQTIPVTPGTHTVCAYGVNIGPGSDALIGCRVVTL